MIRLSLVALIILSFAGVSCSSSSTGDDTKPAPPVETGAYKVAPAFPNLSFNNPLDLQHAGDGSSRLFVVERAGVIKVFKNDSMTSQSSTFLDIRSKISTGGEGGLLGLAFDPDFESNGYFYVNYTASNPFRTIISRFQVSRVNSDKAEPSSETAVLSFKQPFSNHNGGQIRFGPDGYLYIAAGDGGSGGDPQGNAQNRRTLLGAILRIDVDAFGKGKHYSIPPDNPFAGNDQGFREEIYAYGLRNPFRFSFDTVSGKLWAGDVGQNKFEEIDIIQNGGNYGWNRVEGNECYEAENCDKSGLEEPVFVYDHSNNNHSITGGFVYRGSALPRLKGYYIYADFISGRIWALDISDQENPDNTLLMDTDLPISSFGTDAQNELYICAFDGTIYRLAKAN